MTTPDQSKGERSRDEVLAGEYVLGVLDQNQRRQVEERMRSDRRFADMVSRWEQNLSHFDDDYEDVVPSRMLFRRIEGRLFGSDEFLEPLPSGGFRGLWNSLVFWRGLSLAALVMLAVFTSFEMANRFAPSPPPLVAELTGEDNAISLMARYDEMSGRLKVTPVAAAVDAPKSLELWLVVPNGTPKSLGVLPQSGEGEIAVPASLRTLISSGVTLAVSVEPLGGSPTGQATGPVIAAGPTHF